MRMTSKLEAMTRSFKPGPDDRPEDQLKQHPG